MLKRVLSPQISYNNGGYAVKIINVKSYLVGISDDSFSFPIERGMGIFVFCDEAGIWTGEG